MSNPATSRGASGGATRPPVYVYFLSSPRGGSTLTGELLGRHSQGANLGEIGLIPKHLTLGEPCTCGMPEIECPAWSQVFEVLARRTGVDLRTDPYGLFLGDAIKQRMTGGEVDRAHQTPLREALAKARGLVDTAQLLALPRVELLRALTLPSVRTGVRNTFQLYQAAAEAWGVSLLVDASKGPKKGLHLYLDDPARVRLIHLVRDGRSVCASRAGNMGVRRAAERWGHYHRLAGRLLDRWVDPAHWRRVRYEDLARDPEAVLRELLDWLGYDFEPGMLDFSRQHESHSAGGNPARFKVGRGIEAPEEKWRAAFSDREMAEFEARAGAVNRAFGYT